MRHTSVFLTILCLAGSACIVDSGDDFAEPVTVKESVELGGAENVTAEIRMPAGELRVSGGSAKLMEGEFTYTAAALEPEVTYEASASAAGSECAAGGTARAPTSEEPIAGR